MDGGVCGRDVEPLMKTQSSAPHQHFWILLSVKWLRRKHLGWKTDDVSCESVAAVRAMWLQRNLKKFRLTAGGSAWLSECSFDPHIPVCQAAPMTSGPARKDRWKTGTTSNAAGKYCRHGGFEVQIMGLSLVFISFWDYIYINQAALVSVTKLFPANQWPDQCKHKSRTTHLKGHVAANH